MGVSCLPHDRARRTLPRCGPRRSPPDCPTPPRSPAAHTTGTQVSRRKAHDAHRGPLTACLPACPCGLSWHKTGTPPESTSGRQSPGLTYPPALWLCGLRVLESWAELLPLACRQLLHVIELRTATATATATHATSQSPCRECSRTRKPRTPGMPENSGPDAATAGG